MDYLFNNRRPDETVMQAAETAFREVVGTSKMDFVLYEGREQIAAQAQKLMQDILDRYKTGIVDQQGDDAERPAARAGAGGVRRRGEGQAGPGAAEERGPGVLQRRRAARRAAPPRA